MEGYNNLTTTADNLTVSRTFDVTVNPVNDVPTLNALSNITTDEEAPTQTVNLSGITAGGDETQPLKITATSSNTNLIADPAITYTSDHSNGSLEFDQKTNQKLIKINQKNWTNNQISSLLICSHKLISDQRLRSPKIRIVSISKMNKWPRITKKCGINIMKWKHC